MYNMIITEQIEKMQTRRGKLSQQAQLKNRLAGYCQLVKGLHAELPGVAPTLKIDQTEVQMVIPVTTSGLVFYPALPSGCQVRFVERLEG